jgi:hypothetical protein
MGKDATKDDSPSRPEIEKREKFVLKHFLTTKPEPYKPLGKMA